MAVACLTIIALLIDTCRTTKATPLALKICLTKTQMAAVPRQGDATPATRVAILLPASLPITVLYRTACIAVCRTAFLLIQFPMALPKLRVSRRAIAATKPCPTFAFYILRTPKFSAV